MSSRKNIMKISRRNFISETCNADGLPPCALPTQEISAIMFESVDAKCDGCSTCDMCSFQCQMRDAFKDKKLFYSGEHHHSKPKEDTRE